MYLENKLGEKYEFSATQKFKKQYEKENQREVLKVLMSKLTDEDMHKFQNGSEEERNAIFRKYAPEIDIEEIQENINKKYIKLLGCYANKKTEDEMEELVRELYEEYGEEQVNERFAEILNEVFTQVGNVEYKTMPTWN